MATVYIIVQLFSHKCCLQGSNCTLCGYMATYLNYSYVFVKRKPAVHYKFIYAQRLACRNIIERFSMSDKNLEKSICIYFVFSFRKKKKSQLRPPVFVQLDLISLPLNRQLINTSPYSTGINNLFDSIFNFHLLATVSCRLQGCEVTHCDTLLSSSWKIYVSVSCRPTQ